MTDYSQNINAFGPPPGTMEMVRESASSILEYPSMYDLVVRDAYADFFSIDTPEVAHGSGASDILKDLPEHFKDKRAIIFSPSFWEYERFNKVSGKDIARIELDEDEGFSFVGQKLIDELNNGPSTVYLCNPNNPTSQMYDKDALISLTNDFQDSNFVIDETYLLFREDYDEHTLTQFVRNQPNAHVVVSLSKFFAVPGLRSGALISDSATVDEFMKHQPPYSTTAINDKLIPWLLLQSEFIYSTRVQNTQARIRFFTLLMDRLPGRLQVVEPSANFIFAKDLSESGNLNSYLKQRGLITREGSHFSERLGRWLRFVIREPQDNQELTNIMGTYFAEHE